MKKIFASLLLLTSVSAFADTVQWTCEVEGLLACDEPATHWVNTSSTGGSRAEAYQAGMSWCSYSELDQCQVTSCSQQVLTSQP